MVLPSSMQLENNGGFGCKKQGFFVLNEMNHISFLIHNSKIARCYFFLR